MRDYLRSWLVAVFAVLTTCCGADKKAETMPSSIARGDLFKEISLLRGGSTEREYTFQRSVDGGSRAENGVPFAVEPAAGDALKLVTSEDASGVSSIMCRASAIGGCDGTATGAWFGIDHSETIGEESWRLPLSADGFTTAIEALRDGCQLRLDCIARNQSQGFEHTLVIDGVFINIPPQVQRTTSGDVTLIAPRAISLAWNVIPAHDVGSMVSAHWTTMNAGGSTGLLHIPAQHKLVYWWGPSHMQCLNGRSVCNDSQRSEEMLWVRHGESI